MFYPFALRRVNNTPDNNPLAAKKRKKFMLILLGLNMGTVDSSIFGLSLKAFLWGLACIFLLPTQNILEYFLRFVAFIPLYWMLEVPHDD